MATFNNNYNSNNDLLKGNSTLFFYKGTAFPQVVFCDGNSVLGESMAEHAAEMIVLGMRMGKSMEKQKEEYIKQLDLMEQTLFETARGGAMTDKSIREAMALLGQTNLQQFYTMWCLNISALLKMKAIPNDNMNGLMVWDFPRIVE